MKLQSSSIESYAADAFIYGYPLVLSYRCAAGRFNAFFTQRDEELERSLECGARILSAAAWLEIGDQPLIVTLPPTDRYYFVSFFDAWTNALDSMGSRVTGYTGQLATVAGPLCRSADLPERGTIVRSPTSLLRISARAAAYSDYDVPAAADFQARCTIAPITQGAGKIAKRMSPALPAQQGRLVEEIDALSAQAFFAELASLLERNPPLPGDADVRRIVEDLLERIHDDRIERGIDIAKQRIRAYQHPRLDVGGWFFDDECNGFGRDYLRRAATARARLFGDVNNDYVRLLAQADANGNPLDGRSRYRVTFDSTNEPPARGAWLIGTKPPLRSAGTFIRQDVRGKIAIAVQSDEPEQFNSHWLPVLPGAFALVLHVFWPSEQILNGGWIPPSIEVKP